jgi:hypothetical protein
VNVESYIRTGLRNNVADGRGDFADNILVCRRGLDPGDSERGHYVAVTEHQNIVANRRDVRQVFREHLFAIDPRRIDRLAAMASFSIKHGK